MNKYLKKSILFSSVVKLLFVGVAVACAYDFYGDKYNSNFAPEISDLDDSYKPLFLTQDIFYGIRYDDDHISRFNDVIVKEWASYLGGKISEKDVSYFLLDTNSVTDLDQLFNNVTYNRSDDSWSRRIDLTDERVKNFIIFLKYAKRIESKTTTPIDSWSYDPVVPQYVDQRTLSDVEIKYNEATDPFIKNRFWFQVLKAKFYSTNKGSVIPFFESTKAQFPKNTLYYRGLSYVAGAYYKQKQYARSNYLYGVLFHNCKEMRSVATYNFHPQDQSDFNYSLQLASNDEEKIALWTLFGYYADEKQAIREIYKVDPKSRNLDLLLTRLINKEELRLAEEEFKDVYFYKKNLKESLNYDIYELVNSIARQQKTSKPYLWDIAAGYLNILAGNPVDADAFFASAQRQSPSSELILNQIRLLKLINSLFKVNMLDASTEDLLLPELVWLYKECPKSSDERFRYDHALNWSKLYLASMYKLQKNKIYQEIFRPEDDYYQRTANLNAMKSFLTKANKSEWESFIISEYSVTLSDIYEYEAVMSAYKENIDLAVSLMEKSSHATDSLLGDPFMNKIQDCHDCDHAQYQPVKYTKLSFLRKLQVLKSNVARGVDKYNSLLLLGNAYYNITYFGNARKFYYGRIIDQYGNDIEPFYQPYLYNTFIPKSYFTQALQLSASAEQKAKCLYFIAKCERDNYYVNNYYRNTSVDFGYGNEPDFVPWDAFKRLRAECSGTMFYRDVINECGYFRTYLTGLMK